MNLTKPTEKVGNLTGEERKFMLFLVREFVRNTGLGRDLGIDKAEERTMDLIDRGLLRLYLDPEAQAIGFSFWNFINDYTPIMFF